MSTLALDAIKIGERFRREMGDVDALARSIAAIGLINPVTITSDNRLICGERRIAAFRKNGATEIPVRIVDMDSLLRGEHDENEVREGFRPSERVALAKAIENEIGERRGRPSTEVNVGDSPQIEPGVKTREIAAERAGFDSERIYRDARSVVENATPELVEAMDAGDVSISAAATVAKLPIEEQKVVVEAGPDVVKVAARIIREDPPPAGEPPNAAVREAVIEAAKQGLRGEGSQSRRNPLYREPTQAGKAWTHIYGDCRALAEWATEENLKLALAGRIERTDDQSRNIAAVMKAAEILTKFARDINAH